MDAVLIGSGTGVRRLVGLAAVSAALALAGCGGDDDDNGEGTASVAEGPVISSESVESCLRMAGGEVAEPDADAVLAAYGSQAVEAGGDTFVLVDPIAHFIFFPEQVDLEQARSALRDAAGRSGARATGLQADAFGNAVIVYFAPQGGVDKDQVNECLGGEPKPVPTFEAPFQPPDLAPGVIE